MRKIAMSAVFLAAVCLLCAVAAASGGQSPIRDTTVKPDVIIWTPQEGFHEFNLRVSGPSCGEVAERLFQGGETIFFEIAGLADGSYTYQLIGEPILSAEILEQIAEARKRGTSDELFVDLCQAGEIACSPIQADGHFEVIKGRAVLPDLVEEGQSSAKSGISARNQTIAMSLCVGFDCPGNPSYDDTTILMMENNTRIKFDDTSVISGFPNRDWSLVANSRSSGGANRFMLQDCGNSSQGGCSGNIVFAVEANAPSSALYVDDGGRVGIRTSTPSVELHIVDGDTPTVRLAQSGSGGFAPQTWDVAGNETSFFIRDVTNGSTLPLRIRPGAPSSSIDIAADGDIGVGTASPGISGLHIARSSGPFGMKIENTSAGGSEWNFEQDGAGNFQINSPDVAGGPEFLIRDQDGVNAGRVEVRLDLDVGGNLTKGGGSFKIDHPLDPANKYLYHSFVESPDMLNVYNGNARLDDDGQAWVELPQWFEALNRDVRYQLTPIGGAAPNLHVVEEISNNRFKIGGGQPGAKVSWLVTGVRQDPYAESNRIPVEEDKPLLKRGLYLHPEAYGLPNSKGIRWAESNGPAAAPSRGKPSPKTVGEKERK